MNSQRTNLHEEEGSALDLLRNLQAETDPRSVAQSASVAESSHDRATSADVDSSQATPANILLYTVKKSEEDRSMIRRRAQAVFRSLSTARIRDYNDTDDGGNMVTEAMLQQEITSSGDTPGLRNRAEEDEQALPQEEMTSSQSSHTFWAEEQGRPRRDNPWTIMGDGLSRMPFLRNNVKLLLFIVTLCALNIYNEFYMQDKERTVARLELKIYDQYNKWLFKNADITAAEKFESIEKAVEKEGLELQPSTEPPYIIYVNQSMEKKE